MAWRGEKPFCDNNQWNNQRLGIICTRISQKQDSLFYTDRIRNLAKVKRARERTSLRINF
jgi:hypothetical protein